MGSVSLLTLSIFMRNRKRGCAAILILSFLINRSYVQTIIAFKGIYTFLLSASLTAKEVFMCDRNEAVAAIFNLLKYLF